MKNYITISLVALAFTSCSTIAQDKEDTKKDASKTKEVSYALGVSIGENLKS